MNNADSFRAAAAALRHEATTARGRRYAHAYILSAESLEKQADEIGTARILTLEEPKTT